MIRAIKKIILCVVVLFQASVSYAGDSWQDPRVRSIQEQFSKMPENVNVVALLGGGSWGCKLISAATDDYDTIDLAKALRFMQYHNFLVNSGTLKFENFSLSGNAFLSVDNQGRVAYLRMNSPNEILVEVVVTNSYFRNMQKSCDDSNQYPEERYECLKRVKREFDSLNTRSVAQPGASVFMYAVCA